ncbi:reverse transcriptase [Lasius niger]|uniref:Reverse transcriptase n=1 Tax=Lasius niger TaxID=67767 RepID=A0A0J7K3Q2_LASNI|nr:reverse transcriptase [Lasius niger]
MTDVGMRKPDIVTKLGVTAVIVDAQVVNDQISLDSGYAKKIDYYNIIDLIKEKYKVQNITLTSATLSWRGIWSQKSADSFVGLGVQRKRSLKVLFYRVIIGQARQLLMERYDEYLSTKILPSFSGRRVVRAVRPHLKRWAERSHGGVSFHLTKVFTGHGCFGEYLCKIEERRVLQEVVGEDLSLGNL